MKLKVPFIRGLKKWKGSGWCGPIALKSILSYYKIISKVEEIVRIAGTLKQRGTPPNGLIYYCLSKGLKVTHMGWENYVRDNKSLFPPKLRKFFKNGKLEERDKKFLKKCEKLNNYNFIKKKVTLYDIETFIKEGKPVLLPLNLAIIYNRRNEIWPHYVIAVGFDKKNFYMHNIFPKNQSFQKVTKEIFKEALNFLDMGIIIPFR